MSEKYKVGILGATGTVGQRFISLLEDHPQLVVHKLGASSRSSGKPYYQSVRWKMTVPIPEGVKNLVVEECVPEAFKDCDVVFSGLDSSVAGQIEKAFTEADLAVFSNAKNYRQDPQVPLVVPTANPEHLDFIPNQKQIRNLNKGFLVTNANCSVTGLAVVLRALENAFGPISQVIITTLQAISGAGYPGCSALDLIDNVVPFIGDEEDKIELEPLKILGGVHSDGQQFQHLSHMTVSASVNRVPVVDGHTEAVSIKFASGNKPTPQQIIDALDQYRTECQDLGCFSAPEKAIVVSLDEDRPQPRLDRMNGKGNAVTVGRIRECPIFDVKFTLLVHNTILGAAGSSILNAEIAIAKGYLQKQ
ncbi:aspartate-semialdehyde dehydrogenase [Conidiobolus coronatus NRRL 28638]|uniref:Aspartate-semialdehyde dehydrogenase n=1 Tax=Conidiobolus coronatus (strain ATCC 28846 / CBS 209.66 / NRRL 28638) TaxID=796925 RepID=A0A137NRF2_CONC2|nr:aspartate-semialdehyde dehydrogenase [Conidiobolus coronatus NRRL 28638]|eukprot:KXN65302.1 aspartate-semialdehyde dehydrogenase [Conidiobolus coronatus NRRL 28638]